MPDPILTCPVCHSQIEQDDLFCENCGREAPQRDGARRPRTRVATHHFQCAHCGASMNYDASAGTLVCPFCGSKRLDARENTAVLAPDRIVRFAIAQREADERLRRWLGRGFWRPGDLARRARVVEMRPVYVPYWAFRAQVHTYWTADSSDLPAFSRGDWRPVSGEHRALYDGLLVGASGALSDQETRALVPFQLDQAAAAEEVDLSRATVERFAVPRRAAARRAHLGIEARERAACERLVPGRCRNLRVNPRVEGLSGEPILLPVWVMAYRYRDRVFRLLVNGQTGRVTGQAPRSLVKIAAAIVVGLVIAAAIALLLVVAAGR